MEQTREGVDRASAREEFAAAVTEHSRGMFRAARSILDSDADAEDAVDIDAVAGVSFGAWYIPINQDGTVGEGRWLSN